MFNSITVRNVHGGQWMMSICHHFAEFWFFNLAERLITSDNPFCDKPFKFVLIPGSLGNEIMKIPKVFLKKLTYCRNLSLLLKCLVDILRRSFKVSKLFLRFHRIEYFLPRYNLQFFGSRLLIATAVLENRK